MREGSRPPATPQHPQWNQAKSISVGLSGAVAAASLKSADALDTLPLLLRCAVCISLHVVPTIGLIGSGSLGSGTAFDVKLRQFKLLITVTAFKVMTPIDGQHVLIFSTP